MAFDIFKNADSRGSSSPGAGGGSSQEESELFTLHQNTITSVRRHERQSGAIVKVSTTIRKTSSHVQCACTRGRTGTPGIA